jgi:hypothetical protein
MSRYISNAELASVDPVILSAMLVRSGWRELLGKPGILQVLESPDAESEIAIPLNQGFRDYPTRLNEALTDAEEALGGRARPFMLQLVAGPMDELRFEQGAPTVYGSIEWQLGQQLHDTTRLACRAAAKSSQQHLPYFGLKGQGVANRFMEKIRMGQTEVGSYVVTALVPLLGQDAADPEPLIGVEDLGQIESGFFRSVTSSLMLAAEAAVYAARESEQYATLEPFADMVEHGVSADLLDALSKLPGPGQEAAIQALWSPLIGSPEHASSAVAVSPDHLSVFAEAAISFRKNPEPLTLIVTGTVTHLERPFAGHSGTTTLNVITGLPARKLRIRLPPGQYEEAIEAHRNDGILRVTGEHAIVGNQHWLYNPRDIHLEQPPLDLELGEG